MESVSRAVEHTATTYDEKRPKADTTEDLPPSPKPTVSFNDNLEGSEPQPIDPVEALNIPDWREKERQLVRRLDLTFMPIIWILYFHNHIDRNNIASVFLRPNLRS